MLQTRSGNARLQFQGNRNLSLERNILFARREAPKINWKNKLLAPAIVLGSMLIIGSVFIYSYKQKKDTIADIQDNVSNREGRDATVQEKQGFCAVRCRESGPFNLNEKVLVVDMGSKGVYSKEFYTKRGNLYVEGIGGNTERWFRNPNWRGEARVVRTVKMGGKWFADADYVGEEAEQKWREAKSKFSKQASQ